MGRLTRRLAQGESHDPIGDIVRQSGDSRGTGFVTQQAIDALSHEPVLLTLAARMIAAVPWPWAVASMILARQTCFCGLFGCRRRRS